MIKKKTLNKLGTEEMYFNIIKATHNKPIANFTQLSADKLKAFLLRSGIK